LTPFVSGVECFGGIMLMLGLFTRIPAAMLAVSCWSPSSREVGKRRFAGNAAGFEEMTYFAAFLWLAIAGPGAVSLDRLLFARHRKRGRAEVTLVARLSRFRDTAETLSPGWADLS